ncbi:hypothetical protein DXA38_12955 [[Clostridium] innocuum]|uniref:Uncharacterized protein n=1 Tax=Clostridium innocuum TaxID=1522 RepID=A0A3E2VU28_CLOIN|nr:hypothetical protein DXA38_12955 [[Clostridium] innocuum]RHV63287.1 hypothetical protein DXB22_13070 [Clostridiaceae bacterium OM02-2AC]
MQKTNILREQQSSAGRMQAVYICMVNWDYIKMTDRSCLLAAIFPALICANCGFLMQCLRGYEDLKCTA